MDASSKNKIKKQSKKSSFTRGVLEQVELAVVFFAIIILLFSFVCNTCIVEGDSMMNTLQDNERVLIWNMFYKPDYNDIVVIHESGDLNKPIVKRIIGLPGDTITIEHGVSGMAVVRTSADGTTEQLVEDYVYYNLNYGTLGRYKNGERESYVVGDGEVFVMGDNRLNSIDSRELGCVDSRLILGKVVLRITPFDKFGTVK